jgi:hypothetical protein
VPAKVRSDQLGTILVFGDNGNGQPSNVVRIPVVLTA